MKTKKDVLKEYLDDAKESIFKIDITEQYLQEKNAQKENHHILEELAKLQAQKKETEEWITYLETQLQ